MGFCSGFSSLLFTDLQFFSQVHTERLNGLIAEYIIWDFHVIGNQFVHKLRPQPRCFLFALDRVVHESGLFEFEEVLHHNRFAFHPLDF